MLRACIHTYIHTYICIHLSNPKNRRKITRERSKRGNISIRKYLVNTYRLSTIFLMFLSYRNLFSFRIDYVLRTLFVRFVLNEQSARIVVRFFKNVGDIFRRVTRTSIIVERRTTYQ